MKTMLLHYAVDFNDIDRVKYLLAKGVPTVPKKFGQTPLSIAILSILLLLNLYNNIHYQ